MQGTDRHGPAVRLLQTAELVSTVILILILGTLSIAVLSAAQASQSGAVAPLVDWGDWVRFASLLLALGACAVYLERRLSRLETTVHHLMPLEVFNQRLGDMQTALVREIGDLKSVIVRDIANVRTDVGNFRSDFKTDVSNVRNDLKNDMTNLRTDLKQEITQETTGLRAEVMRELRESRSDPRRAPV